MSKINAWILDFGMGYKAAVGSRELLHLIDVPASFVVPCTPSYCHRVLFWQGNLLPLMDIAARLCGTAQQSSFVAVVGFQQRRGEYPQFGALQLASPPEKVAVSDDQACGLPGDNRVWNEFAISCFDHLGLAVPVLNVKRLFGTPPL